MWNISTAQNRFKDKRPTEQKNTSRTDTNGTTRIIEGMGGPKDVSTMLCNKHRLCNQNDLSSNFYSDARENHSVSALSFLNYKVKV